MKALLGVFLLIAGWTNAIVAQNVPLQLNDLEYFEAGGVNVLAYSNRYSGLFSDSKLSGIELIHHGVRTATNGDVRLSNTPEQWDPIPQFVAREADIAGQRVRATLSYPDFDFNYQLVAESAGDGVRIQVQLDTPLPDELVGVAGFNLEFLPSAYFGKTYVMDDQGGLFPRHPTGPVLPDRITGLLEAAPLATGNTLVLAPEDPERRVTVTSTGLQISLYDGRNKAQNGWYVVRGMLPANETGTVLEWLLTPFQIPGWIRPPVITHSQIGYHPDQEKVAVIELDPKYQAQESARLIRLEKNGDEATAFQGPAVKWGPYLRYSYLQFDFSAQKEPGLYVIEYGGIRSGPFRIDRDVYDTPLWTSTLDTFMPVQMDHVLVNDNYRVWHGASHLDDALQAPVDHEHFDLYAQGPTTDTPYEPGEHIPGLNIGGWYDAGDYDIRTQSQYGTVTALVHAYEWFDIDWDQTTVEQENRFVDLRRPDGVPDMLQQIEHGALALIAQFRAVGHAIPGIIVPTIEQYTHLGDGITMTDNLIYSAALDSLESDGFHSGTFDDRWAFTSKSTVLDYGSIAALAAASRVLRVTNKQLAEECLQTAIRVWDEEQSRDPIIFRYGNTTGGRLESEELNATVELLVTTGGEQKYLDHVIEMWPFVESSIFSTATQAVRVLPFLDESYRTSVEQLLRTYKTRLDESLRENPYGVPISRGGWGGAGGVLGFAMRGFILHNAFPDIFGPEYTLRGLNYVLGTHPASSVSLVSGIGAHSKTVAYGTNRADYSFIPGGIVPGIVVVQPDFPELKEDWPFLWFENEYVIPIAPSFIFVANAANRLLE